jgi:hypothetical protein
VQLDPESKYVWRRPEAAPGKHRRTERANQAFDKFFSRQGQSADVHKRQLFQEGIEGRAEIIRAPRRGRVDSKRENLGKFRVRVEVPDREPYEVKVKQSFFKDEWERLQPGNTVACSVDPENPKRVLLVAPEPPKA